MNIRHDAQLRVALTQMEGTSAIWDSTGDLTLLKALEIFNAIPEAERADHEGHYATIYGSGGWHRYYVNMATGEVTFSAHHATPASIAKAQALGFNLH